MKLIKNAALFVAAILLSINVMAQTKKDIVDVAVGFKPHTKIVGAVKAADLVTTLKSDGPFIVFAPTNNAFAKLPAVTVDNLLKPENKYKLAGLLTYHVVGGNHNAKTVFVSH